MRIFRRLSIAGARSRPLLQLAGARDARGSRSARAARVQRAPQQRLAVEQRRRAWPGTCAGRRRRRRACGAARADRRRRVDAGIRRDRRRIAGARARTRPRARRRGRPGSRSSSASTGRAPRSRASSRRSPRASAPRRPAAAADGCSVCDCTSTRPPATSSPTSFQESAGGGSSYQWKERVAVDDPARHVDRRRDVELREHGRGLEQVVAVAVVERHAHVAARHGRAQQLERAIEADGLRAALGHGAHLLAEARGRDRERVDAAAAIAVVAEDAHAVPGGRAHPGPGDPRTLVGARGQIGGAQRRHALRGDLVVEPSMRSIMTAVE